VSSQVLRTQLEEKAAATHRGLFSLHMYVVDQASASPLTTEIVDTISQDIRRNSMSMVGLPVESLIVEMQTGSIHWRPVKSQYKLDPNEPWFSFGFFTMNDLQAHATLVEGAWPQPSSDPSAPIQVALHDLAADVIFVNVGDVFRYKDVQIEITGFWKPISISDTYWFQDPNSAYNALMWVPQETYEVVTPVIFKRPVFFASWYAVIKESALQFSQAPEYARGLVRMDFALNERLAGMKTDYSPVDALEEYEKRAESLTTFFYAVGAPMIVLALLFISLTASIAVQQYEQETATMRGRGTSWQQVAGLNIIESLVLMAAALIPSLLLGWLAAFVMGKTLSFLRFTDRAGIPFGFQGINLLWILIAAVVIVLSRFLPMLGVARTSIVRMKQQQSRGAKKPLWERFFIDFFLLLPGIYAYLTMSGVAENNKILARLQAPATGQYRDLLLYVAPSLFAIALCMLTLRVLPLVLRLLAKITDRLPQVWIFLSIQQIARRPQDHSSAILLIMISLSLAIYSSSTAKTLDRWLHDSLYYKSGADLVVHEFIMQGGGPVGPPGGAQQPVTVVEIDLSVDSYLHLEEHRKLPTLEAVTRVGKYDGTFSFGVGELSCAFMGIDRLEFPAVAFFRDDFSNISFGGLLNQLGTDINAVLVPRELAEERGLRLGDQLDTTITVLDQRTERSLVISGFYDYFPTIYPGDKPTLIVNFDGIFDNPEAVIGYDIWLKLRRNVDPEIVLHQIRKILGEDRAIIEVRGDAYREVKKMMDQPERVGLFGILNVGFLMTGLMPGIGFILYSYASLRRRFIQLGILQAIGLSVKNLIGYLISEQFILMSIAILGGAVIGLGSSYLFVPFLQIGATSGAPVPPFEVLIGWTESFVISFIFFLVLVSTMVGTISYLMRMKVFQAVKMGETL
jgi:putative ABC transport system permease protein